MKKIFLLLLLLALTGTGFAQTGSVQVDANGTVLNFQSPSTKAVNFPTGKLTVNGVQITGLEADASTTVKGVSKLSVAPASSTNPVAVGDNDSRNTNARTPTAHAGTHANAGSDPVTLIISQITGLQSALDLKAPLASPTFTGVPLAPTAAVDTNTTQIATTGFVLAQAANATPIIASTGAVGTSTRYARQDHIHPAQTSVTGNAATATALQTARTINGTSFDGTASITVTAAAGTLTGTTLASNVTASSLLSASGGSFGTAAFTASSAYATSSQGVTTLSLATPNVLYTTPVTFSNSSGAWTGTLSLNTQSANTVFAGPTTGSAATPTMRALVLADLPSLTSASLRSLLSDENGTGVALFDGATSPAFVTPKITTGINDANGNSMFAFTATASSIFGFTLTNAASGGIPTFGVTTPTQAASGIVGTPLTLTASNAVAGSSNAGAVAGGDFNITAGNAARLTSGNANGGNIVLVPGTGIGTGTTGTVRIMSGANYTGFSSDGFITTFIQNGSSKATLNNSGDFGATTYYINGDTYLRRNAAGIFEITGGTAGQWGGLKLGTRDSGTNTITNGLTLGHQSTSTPAVGLGEAILFNLDSTTTADQNAARIYAAWTTATHASRTSKYVVQTVNNAGALADAWTVNGDGSASVGTTLGVGTTAPTNGIDIYGTGTNLNVYWHTDLTGTTTSDGFNIGIDRATSDVYLVQRENAPVHFWQNTTERLVITGSGGVNIGDNNNISAGKLSVAVGYVADSGGLKHKRVTTGSVSGGSTALVTITWTTAFADANYTVTANVIDSTTTSLSLSVVHIESVTASAVTVRVLNNAVTALTGTINCIAIHD